MCEQWVRPSQRKVSPAVSENDGAAVAVGAGVVGAVAYEADAGSGEDHAVAGIAVLGVAEMEAG